MSTISITIALLASVFPPIFSLADDFERDFNKNTAQFCDDLMAIRVIHANPKYFKIENEEQLQTAMEKVKNVTVDDSQILDHIIPRNTSSPWSYSLIPSRSLRHRAMAFSFNFFRRAKFTFDKLDRSEYPKIVGAEEINDNVILRAIKAIDTLSDDYKNNPRTERPMKEKDYEKQMILSPYKWNSDWTKFYNKIDQVGGSSFVSAGLCMDLLGLSRLGCGSELEALLKIMLKDSRSMYGKSSEDLLTIVDLPNFEDVLGDPGNILPLLEAAKVLLSRYQSPPNMPVNLYSDLYNAFKAAGLDDENAAELKWKVVGLLGSTGANLAHRLRYYTDGYTGSRYALSIISTALPFLDHVTSHNGLNIYSFPENVKATCNSGKSYHFMMSAYFSRKLTKEKNDPLKTAALVYQTAKAYSAGLRNRIKGSDAPSSPPKSNSAAGEVVRIDLAYNAVGAMYGSFPERTYDTDQTVLHLKKFEGKGGFSIPGMSSVIGLYFKDFPGFMKDYNPNEAFHFNRPERN